MDTERHFGTDETGTQRWQLATPIPNIDVACHALLQESDAAPKLLRSNLEELLERLAGS